MSRVAKYFAIALFSTGCLTPLVTRAGARNRRNHCDFHAGRRRDASLSSGFRPASQKAGIQACTFLLAKCSERSGAGAWEGNLESANRCCCAHGGSGA